MFVEFYIRLTEELAERLAVSVSVVLQPLLGIQDDLVRHGLSCAASGPPPNRHILLHAWGGDGFMLPGSVDRAVYDAVWTHQQQFLPPSSCLRFDGYLDARDMTRTYRLQYSPGSDTPLFAAGPGQSPEAISRSMVNAAMMGTASVISQSVLDQIQAWNSSDLDRLAPPEAKTETTPANPDVPAVQQRRFRLGRLKRPT